MNLTRPVMITVGVLFTLLIVIEMQGLLAGSWTVVGQELAALAIGLVFFGIAITLVIRRGL